MFIRESEHGCAVTASRDSSIHQRVATPICARAAPDAGLCRTVQIDDVIDLRFAEAQSWFSEHFKALEEAIGLKGHAEDAVEVATYKYNKPENFRGLLATLVIPGRRESS